MPQPLEETARFESAWPAYQQKIRTFVRLNVNDVPGFDEDDLESELQEVLWLACRHYDPDRGATFNTCFWEFVKRKIIDLKRYAFRAKRVANMNTYALNDDAVRYAIEEATSVESAEEMFLAKLTVEERYRSR